VKLQVNDLVQTPIPTQHGEFILHYYRNNLDDKEHIALVKGEVAGKSNVPVRIHSECFTGDVLGSRRCDCGEQLDLALQIINAAGFGVLVYLRQEGRGIGLLNKLRAYNLQDKGLDTVDANIHLGHLADEREYDMAGVILGSLQVGSVELITNNPKKIAALEKLGITVTKRIPVEAVVHQHNVEYLKTKAKKMAHLLFEAAHKKR
jgi:GTP cyclohydrolase II